MAYRWDPPPPPPHRYEWMMIEQGEPWALVCGRCGDVKQTSWESPFPAFASIPAPRIPSEKLARSDTHTVV